MKLFRVYTYTVGDTAIVERLVAQNDARAAESSAIANVKAQNPAKGLTSMTSSQANTSVLVVREAGKDGVLCVSRIPVDAIDTLAYALNPNLAKSQELLDHRQDILRLADLPEGSDLSEALKIIEARLGTSYGGLHEAV